MTSPNLDALLKGPGDGRPLAPPTENVEIVALTPRLTTGACLLTLFQLGTQLGLAHAAFEKLPNGTQEQATETLKEIIAAVKSAQGKAERLLAGNR